MWNSLNVCVNHGAFVPCRRKGPEDPCDWSDEPEDVARVRDYQIGKTDDWR